MNTQQYQASSRATARPNNSGYSQQPHYIRALHILRAKEMAHSCNAMLRMGASTNLAASAACHDRDIPPQPSHTYSCPPAVQTPPEHSLTKPEPIPGLPNPSTAFPNPSAAFPKGMLHRRLLSKHSRSGEHHSRTHLTIPDEPKTSRIPSTNPELACSPPNPKTQYAQPRSGEAQTLSSIPD